MQQVHIKEILWAHQIPSTFIKLYTASQNDFLELWVHLENSGKFAPKENNPLYGIYVHTYIY